MSKQRHPVTILIAEDDPDDCLLIRDGDLHFAVDVVELPVRTGRD